MCGPSKGWKRSSPTSQKNYNCLAFRCALWYNTDMAAETGKGLQMKECHYCYRTLPDGEFKSRGRACKRCVKEFRLIERYGISLPQYKTLLHKQNGVCAICKKPETLLRNGVTQPLSVDHDHVTGKVRGLLCRACNLMLGLSDESPTNLLSAIRYLIRTI